MLDLPDPTSDLQWGLWNGAIHEIFHRNAQAHPERTCVTETSPRRVFTYRHIDQASNTLAHYLVSTGIERGDVVMIYAFRNVDLVVAIMGTLKAGATFSVIDPAYPPNRQIVYLDVARPKALVIIGKAKGGGLSDQVNAWIRENLQLKGLIPNLTLHDNGRLDGGVLGQQDVLADAYTKHDSPPDVVVGPDSNPTLSFTSGSEGRPKGVLGRHFSLVHYFPWMADKFGLSSSDRFTMLSGISHDPVQRDIFTPLFLGAQIMVPSTEDIQHEKLAVWMKEHRATVTHLTPAMGQILVGGASTQFPDLKNAFFVGDVLIKRDVRRLQELARNVQTINMFGTTETQRAVSYFAIPSRTEDSTFLDHLGDRIPAGRGMNNVQLLVVDRDNRQRICDVGEQGEIYVRAAGLAEGYLGLADTTREKFIPSWFLPQDHWSSRESETAHGPAEPWREFYHGARDRLYRSGDLGHYSATGDVECTGRIDSQVKIRGFRIELGEIDTHLSHHPIVRESVTLTRRDKDEEHMLVSYIVPEMSRWSTWLAERDMSDEEHDPSMSGMLKRFQALRDALKDYLKTKVPVYAVPSVIIALDRMPLNPNGKIDKPALPFPESAELSPSLPHRSSADTASRSSTEGTVAKIWSSLLQGVPADTINVDDSFFDLGGHSLMVTRLPFTVRQKFGDIDISLQDIQNFPTLRQYALQVDRAADPQGRVLDYNSGAQKQGPQYADDARELARTMPESFPTATVDPVVAHTVLLTGATGFLGAFLLANLLSRENVKVYAHVRAKTSEAAADRVRQTCTAYGVWHASWSEKLICIPGDLESPRLGVSEEKWAEMAEEVDMIIANGARVHWIDPYSKLRAANVGSLLALFDLCLKSRPKHITFVSSTSALDTSHYISLSDQLAATGHSGIPESDDLSGAESGLQTGYGQTKWVGEYMMREAGKRGLRGTIARPGYVLGDSKSGISISDDYLVRLLKGCQQVGAYPVIPADINTVPVDTVAAITVAATLHMPSDNGSTVRTTNIVSHPRRPLSTFLSALPTYGYDVAKVSFEEWRTRIEASMQGSNSPDNALAPLAHLVLGDLPSSTVAPALDDASAMAALRADLGISAADAMVLGVDVDLVGRYLAYLVSVGFLPRPSHGGVKMGLSEMGSAQREALQKLSGRGAVA